MPPCGISRSRPPEPANPVGQRAFPRSSRAVRDCGPLRDPAHARLGRAATADALYDRLADRLSQDAFKPRALFDRFKISVLATTDDPCDDLGVHAALVADPTWSGRVIPTFRPDRYLEASGAGWPAALVADPTWSGRVIPTFRPDRYLEASEAGWSAAVARLGAVSGEDTSSYKGWVTAMQGRREYFISRGAVSADHAHTDCGTEPLANSEADRIYRAAVASTATLSEAVSLRRHMLLEMARMSTQDGLTMTIHAGVRRDHHHGHRGRVRTRRKAGAGSLTVVPCDNLPGNGAAVARVIGDVSYATTMVNRITSEPTPQDRDDHHRSYRDD